MNIVKELLSQLDETARKERVSLSEKQKMIDILCRWNDLYKEVFYLRLMESGRGVFTVPDELLNDITKEATKHCRNEKVVSFLWHYPIKMHFKEFLRMHPALYKSQYVNFFTNILQQFIAEREQKYNAAKEKALQTMNQLPLAIRPQFRAMSANQIMTTWRDTRQHTLQSILWDYTLMPNPHYRGMYMPVVANLQNNPQRNFLFTGNTGKSVHWKRLVIQILLSLPVRSVRFSMINMDFNIEVFKLEQQLHSSIVNEEHVNSLSELKSWAKKKYEVLKDTCLKYGDLEKYNRTHSLIAQPYEVCIVSGLSTDNSYDRSEEFKILLREGYHAGIFFLVLGALPSWIVPSLFTDVFACHSDETIWSSTFHDQLLALLREEIDEKDMLQLQETAFYNERQRKELFTREFADATYDFRVEMGKDVQTQAVQYFELDEGSHPHSLILGKSGSGKSNFIHVLLQNAVLNYGPDTLQLYLMDLKKGGVELNRYRDYPHVRVLLVSDTNLSIVSEILNDIDSLMDERGILLRESGCNNLKRYNELHPEYPMPRILVLADEFHILFGNDNKTGIQTNIEKKIIRMVTEGRSQGVHLILATQGLTGSDIPTALQEKMTDVYFMNCNENDVERLTSKDSAPLALLRQLPKYGVFRQNHQTKEYETFIPYKMEENRMEELLRAIRQKKVRHPVNFTPYYYDGKRTCNLADDIGGIKSGRYPECVLGRNFKVRSTPVSVRLRPEEAENLLIVGTNDQGQGTRVLLTSLISLMYYHKKCGKKAHFHLILNGEIENEEQENTLYNLEKWGVEIADSRATRTALLKKLYQQIMNRSYSEEEQSSNEVKQYICLLGQDFYHEMRKNNDIEVEISVNKKREEYCKNRDARGKLVFPMLYKNNGSEEKKKQEEADAKDTEMISVSTRQVWQTLLKDGPERGIHSLWQLNNVNKFFHNTENHVYMRDLEKYFSSIAFLRMPEEDSRFSTVKMDLQKLNSDFENLQLALYSLEKSDYELLSPYVQPTGEEIERLLYKEQ